MGDSLEDYFRTSRRPPQIIRKNRDDSWFLSSTFTIGGISKAPQNQRIPDQPGGLIMTLE